MIDWKKVVDSLQGPGTPAYIDPDKWQEKKDYNEIARLWVDADMNFGGVSVSNYEPGQDYDVAITHQMEQILGLTHVESWISRVNPGSCAPYHWDFDHPSIATLPRPAKRVSIHISEFAFGHVFILEDQCFYNYKLGDMHEFPHIRAWHAGANIGLVPKYMYHFVGY